VQGAARVGDPIGERVADPLQLGQVGDARLGSAGGDAGVERDAGEGLGPQARQLVLKTPDLAPQLSAREALIASDAKRRERVSVKQILHEP
jgi:hypothetical protein